MTAARGPVIRRHRLRGGTRARPVLAALTGALAGVAILAASTAAAGTMGLGPLAAAGASGAWLAPAAGPASPGVAGHLPRAPSGRPTWVRIPSIGVSAALEPLTVDRSGRLTPPANFDNAGWYAAGTVPGDIGPAVIAGHIDSQCCPAVFYRLAELKPGDLVEVDRGGRMLTFTVIRSGRYPKADFPTSEVYNPTPDPELRLITCGGEFDKAARSYVDNVVVYAVATP